MNGDLRTLFCLGYCSKASQPDVKIKVSDGGGFSLDFCREEKTSYRWGDAELELFCNQRKSQPAEQEVFIFVSG